ncbi:citrate lyase acyl carrier protein [Clostridium tepidiprofundi DSM 19306]|uniref:Citrate lyase acyl carrier protein n=1 Tax=Clostridium tepidiprofundi DSM 19306 TaxID=1121338 RepID=A0A151B798_9CLOT|nr:citrate lyase acyl carrier protein [Clostridium tepidiprofundi]KYH35769.1 citrate lyase acyl carrier protein [Clostridium tepidiprofundi DSM 19306]
MEIKTRAVAGTSESSDITIILEPSDSNEININLTSSAEKQFGRQIRKVINNTLMELGITRANVTAIDFGALDCVIKARVQTAAYRAAESKEYKW